MRQLTIAVAIGAIAVATAACSAAGSSPKPAGGTGGTIEGVNWRLGSFAVSGKMTDVPQGVIVDATFAVGSGVGLERLQLVQRAGGRHRRHPQDRTARRHADGLRRAPGRTSRRHTCRS